MKKLINKFVNSKINKMINASINIYSDDFDDIIRELDRLHKNIEFMEFLNTREYYIFRVKICGVFNNIVLN